MQERTRLVDLADRAAVSIATVSRVLNGRPGVAPETRSRVLAALDESGYLPAESSTARLVGLAAPGLDQEPTAAIAQAVQTDLGAADLTAVLCSHAGQGGLAWAVETLLRRKVVGVVAVGPARLSAPDLAALDRLVAQQVALVRVNLPEVDAGRSVRSDTELGAGLAVRHLTDLGHRRVGLLADQLDPRQVADFGAACPAGPMRRTTNDLGSAERAAAELIEDGATALVCGTDLLALGALRAAEDRGLDVPGQLSLVAAVDSPLAVYARPALSAVRHPVAELGRTAVHLIVSAIDQPDMRRGGQEVVLPPDLVLRGSTAPPAVP